MGLLGAAGMPAFLPSFPGLSRETCLPATRIVLCLGVTHNDEGAVDYMIWVSWVPVELLVEP